MKTYPRTVITVKGKPLTSASVNLSGWLCVNGEKVSSRIQTIFKTCTDTLTPFRQDAQERFQNEMEAVGLGNEAQAILRFANQ